MDDHAALISVSSSSGSILNISGLITGEYDTHHSYLYKLDCLVRELDILPFYGELEI